MWWRCRRRRSRPGGIVCSFSAGTTGKLIIEWRRRFYRSVTGNGLLAVGHENGGGLHHSRSAMYFFRSFSP